MTASIAGPPTITATAPATPGNDLTPNVIGSADAGTTVTVFKQAGCGGTAAASGSAATFGAAGRALHRGHARRDDDVLGAARPTLPATRRRAPPASSTRTTTTRRSPPTIFSTTPPSPSNISSPDVNGFGEPNATLDLFVDDAACSGAPRRRPGRSRAGGIYTVEVALAPNQTHAIRARLTDTAGNAVGLLRARSPTSRTRRRPRRRRSPARSRDRRRRTRRPPCSAPASPACRWRSSAATPAARSRAAWSRSTATATGRSPAPRCRSTRPSGLRTIQTDAAGNGSDCSSPFTYTHDTVATAAADAGRDRRRIDRQHADRHRARRRGSPQTVRLYRSATCTGAAVATGAPGALSGAGLTPASAQLNAAAVSYSAERSTRRATCRRAPTPWRTPRRGPRRRPTPRSSRTTASGRRRRTR